MPITQQDIADRVGVSRRLVSYALNGGASVNEETQNRILSVAAELGYQANRAAQTLVTGRTNQIALCVPTLSSPFHGEFIRHFEAYARHTTYDLLITTTLDKSNALSKLAVDGMLLHHTMPIPSGEILCPTVVLQSPPSYAPVENQSPFDQVLLDLSKASEAAVHHLLKSQKTRIAFVSFGGMLVDEPRYMAYLQVMKQANLKPEVILLDYWGKGALRPLADQVLQEYFVRQGFPDALFCCNDEVAIGAYRALRALGRKIPDQTKVVGCDDISEIEDLFPSLTSIRHSWGGICACAWGMLMTRIQNPGLPSRKISFQGELIIRSSSV